MRKILTKIYLKNIFRLQRYVSNLIYNTFLYAINTKSFNCQETFQSPTRSSISDLEFSISNNIPHKMNHLNVMLRKLLQVRKIIPKGLPRKSGQYRNHTENVLKDVLNGQNALTEI